MAQRGTAKRAGGARGGPASGPEADPKARARAILRGLRKLYPDADCALVHTSPYQLLVATILSAQCTDARVNQVTPQLFSRFPSPRELAAADPSEVEDLIRSTGFFRNKTKSLLGMARGLVERHKGLVPQRMDDLLELPGVARKTANVILGTAFGRNDGVVVDTHVFRLSHRLDLSRAREPGKVEQDLMRLFPRRSWTFLSHALIWHGRRVCSARKPDCPGCGLRKHCPSADSI